MTFPALNAAGATAPQAALLAARMQDEQARQADAFGSLLAQAEAAPAQDAGRTRYRAAHGVPNLMTPLHLAGLPGQLKEGTASVVVRRADGTRQRYPIRVNLTGPRPTTMGDLLDQLQAIPELHASWKEGLLRLETRTPGVTFTLEDEGNTGLWQALGDRRQEFEQAFVQMVGTTLYGQMVRQLRSSVGKPPYLHGGYAEEMFQRRLDELVVDNLTRRNGKQLAAGMLKQQLNLLG